MTDTYLKEKLEEYIEELTLYHKKLDERRKSNPKLKDQIALVIDKVDLETSYLEDELA